jgi:MoxR-like ATPase
VRVPLISLFAASNEVPTDDALSAIFDRFLLRVRCDYLDSYHFRGLLQKGIQLETAQMSEHPRPARSRPPPSSCPSSAASAS